MTLHTRWRALGVLALVMLIAAIAAGAWRAPAPTEASVTILGERTLQPEGDSATWCGLIVMTDGSLRLGRTALRVWANADSVVMARALPDPVPACRPLLRARGIHEDLPLTNMQWGLQGVTRRRPAVRRGVAV